MEFKICNQGRHLIFNQKTYKFNIAMKKYLKKYCSYNQNEEVYSFNPNNNIPKSDFESKIKPFLKEISIKRNTVKYISFITLFLIIASLLFTIALLRYKKQVLFDQYTTFNSKSEMIKTLGFPTNISGSKSADIYFYDLRYHELTCKLFFSVSNETITRQTDFNDNCAELFNKKYYLSH